MRERSTIPTRTLGFRRPTSRISKSARGWFDGFSQPDGIVASACRCQGLLEVSDQIGGVLYADRETQKITWRGRSRTFDRGAVLDEALNASKRRGSLPHRHLRGRRDRRALAAGNTNDQHPSEAAEHLARGDGVTGMLGQTGIEHSRDAAMADKMLGN